MRQRFAIPPEHIDRHNAAELATLAETMAEVRARVTCAEDGCSSLEPSMNIVYRDVWSADPAIAAQNTDIELLYSDLVTPLPTLCRPVKPDLMLQDLAPCLSQQ